MHPAFTHCDSRRRGWLPRTLIAAGAVSALLLAGCSGSGTSSTEAGVKDSAPAQDRATGNSAPDAQSAPDAKSGTAGAPSAGPADIAKPGAPVTGSGAKLTRNASLDLRVKDVAAGAARVRGIALGQQAQVLSEQIGRGDPGGPVPLQEGSESPSPQTGFGTLTLSVPADKLDTALDQISKQVGTVLSRSTSSQDVTAQYVDTESRLKTMRASVARVRALMTQAKDIGQVVALESELSRRQADLESLESQLGALKNSVERSTLTVSLSTPGNEPETSNGFLA
ncbi:MAG TPA: DUF4349 domain-containing protein, partial [Dermatophilaceae bacterium]|nr:DUF4349 domain-containing protein [Dermatophilaceae bacterium]